MSKPTPEVLSFQASRVADQAAAPLRKLTALELLGRAPQPISIPEFDGAVFYFSNPPAKQVLEFFESRSRIVREMQKAQKANNGDLSEADAEQVTSIITPEQTEDMRLASCKLLALMVVNEDGTPMFTLEQVSEEMSREMFMILTTEMTKFLNRGMGAGIKRAAKVKDGYDSENGDEDTKSALITLEDELDTPSTPSPESVDEDSGKNV